MDTTRAPILCDLDGVIWLAHQPIEGSSRAVAHLRAAGHRVIFVTNNSFSLLAEHEEALARLDIDAHGEVITSSMAAATLVDPGERVMVVGGAGIIEALTRRGATVITEISPDDDAVDAVMVGLDRALTYDRLARATRAIVQGARLIGTNEDATFPTPNGPVPGGGAILAALRAATGQQGVVAGKPHPPMVEAVRLHLDAAGADLPEWWSQMVMVGDRPSTDGAFAHALGCRFALVRSGVTAPGEDPTMAVDLDAPDLAAIANLLL